MSPCTDSVDPFSGSEGRPQARATLGAPRMMEFAVVIKRKSASRVKKLKMPAVQI